MGWGRETFIQEKFSGFRPIPYENAPVLPSVALKWEFCLVWGKVSPYNSGISLSFFTKNFFKNETL